MKNKSWKTLKTEVFKQTSWVTFRQNEFEASNGKRGTYYFVDTGGSVFIVPITKDGNVVLINQYRYLVDMDSLEFPGGGVGKSGNYEDAARRELKEETGYIAENLKYVGEFVPMNGVTNEICKVYLVKCLEKGEQNLDETEEGMEIIETSINEFEEKIMRGEIKDGMTLAAWQLAKSKIKIN